jgi:carboxylate-amine ligase
VASLTALVQCLVVALSDRYDAGVSMGLLKPWVIRENKWRAARHGLDASIITDNDGHNGPLRVLIPELVERLSPIAERLNCHAELQGIYGMLERGASYERQRRTMAHSRRLPDVVASLSQELRDSVDAIRA